MAVNADARQVERAEPRGQLLDAGDVVVDLRVGEGAVADVVEGLGPPVPRASIVSTTNPSCARLARETGFRAATASAKVVGALVICVPP